MWSYWLTLNYYNVGSEEKGGTPKCQYCFLNYWVPCKKKLLVDNNIFGVIIWSELILKWNEYRRVPHKLIRKTFWSNMWLIKHEGKSCHNILTHLSSNKQYSIAGFAIITIKVIYLIRTPLRKNSDLGTIHPESQGCFEYLLCTIVCIIIMLYLRHSVSLQWRTQNSFNDYLPTLNVIFQNTIRNKCFFFWCEGIG